MSIDSLTWLKLSPCRLRDITQETDYEQRRRIAEMEKDVTSLDEIQSMYAYTPLLAMVLMPKYTAQYESTLVKLSNAEVQIEDLKVQLDDALGAEDLVEQLTERNLMLGEVRFKLSYHIAWQYF